MTDLLPLFDGDDEGAEDDSQERRRSMWSLFAIALLAISVLGIVTIVLGSGGGSHHSATPDSLSSDVTGGLSDAPAPATQAAVSSPVNPTATASKTPTKSASASASASKSPSKSPRKSASASPPHRILNPSHAAPPASNPGTTSNPCPSQQACILPSAGDTIEALKNYRVDNGLDPSVLGEITAAAQNCAVSQGDSCRTPYAFAPESSLNGSACIADIGAGSGNFLLDPSMQSFEVGWAYDPASGRYLCSVIEN